MTNRLTTLQPKDVPGATLRNISIEDHSVLELQRWLECRGYKKNGSKEQLVTRVKNCIKAGNENKIFLGIDGGKSYDLKRKILQTPNSSSSNSQAAPLVWGSFPSCDIPQYYNKGHIYTYIVGANIDDEDPETAEINPINSYATTVKPFKRGSQFVSSDHISDIEDGRQGNVYFCKSKCLSSFQKTVKYNVSVSINNISGAIIEGTCECKQSAMGKCSHITALLLFIWEYVEKYRHRFMASTSLPRQWSLGSKKRNPRPVISTEYPIKRYRPTQRAVFNPIPEEYVRNISLNDFIGDLQKAGGDGSMFQSVLHLEYEDFDYSTEEKAILKIQTEQFLANMRNFANRHDSILFEIPGTSPQGTADWLKWRTYFIRSSNVKFVVIQSHSENATKHFFLKNLWLENKYFETVAMGYGKENESKARQEYAATFLQDNQRLIEVDLANKRNLHLATSLDGIVMGGADIHHIIEIKCAKVLENCRKLSDFDDVLSKSQLSNFFLVKKNGNIYIRDKHPYLYQIISSLVILESETCHLVVWSPKSLLMIPVHKKNHLHLVEDIKNNTFILSQHLCARNVCDENSKRSLSSKSGIDLAL